MPFFSVITPSYNREALIGATLDSIFAQSFRDFEVIVVDDGSTDGTLGVVARYGERVKVLRQKNSGPGAARNAGIAAATGEYIAFLDSDDLWFPWSLETYKRVIDERDRPAFVTGSPFVFSDETQVRSVQPAELRVAGFRDYFASCDAWRWFSCSSFVIRRAAVVAAGGFTSEWVNAEDADLAMRIGAAPGFANIQSPMTFAYREHATSLVANIRKTYQGLDRMVGLERRGEYPGGRARRGERREILARYVRPHSLELLRRGEVSLAWSLYARTFGWNLALGRVSYLLAFPPLSGPAVFRGKSTSR